ncbi:MAG: hypothetical protein KUF74_17775 [Candidatus Thiodiazotropha sp. (ex Ctena orbiculata)]|nr:hypothetical protein [Candidatus Thiodiazotropha taylori]MCG7967185.1 hypothetical protein [Candidatus Thiodiazotropha taylori]
MMEQLYKIALTSFAIGTLFLPLLLFVNYLEARYPATTQLTSLAWYEMFIILMLLVIPFGTLKLLRVPWNGKQPQ